MDALIRSRKVARRARYQRYRARQRAGVTCVNTEISAAIIDLLVLTRWLAERDVTDAKAIAAAIKLCLEVAAKAAL
jgi:hypothetical protein